MLRTKSILFVLAVVAMAVAADAHQRRPYSMEVLVDGEPLQALHARGKTYVEALAGKEYSIRLTNHTGGRVAVALAVDGLNSINAQTTTAAASPKWILAPYQTAVISGWQTGSDTARRFYFTTEEDSYGAWLGRTKNLGVVSAAFFRERVPQPVPYEGGERQKRRNEADSGAPAPAAPEGGMKRESSSLSDEHAATGIGREVDHRVERVEFEAEPDPAAVVELRYEYRDALVALGVLPRGEKPLERREGAHGFDDFRFAPAPAR